MKKLAIIIIILTVSQLVYSQQFIPLKTRLSNPVTPGAGGTAIRGFAANNIATATTAAGNTNEVAIKIVGLGGATDIAEAKKVGGALSLGTYIMFESGQLAESYNQFAFYLMFNAREGIANDTNTVERAFLFPEVGKRDLTLGFEWPIQLSEIEGQFSSIPYFEFSWNRNLTDNVSNPGEYFHTTNFSLGVRFALSRDFTIGNEDEVFGVSIAPYYQNIATDPKDFQLRNVLLKDSEIPPTLHTFGLNATLQLAELGLFGNYKFVINEGDMLNRNLRGGNLVIGALIGTDIFNL